VLGFLARMGHPDFEGARDVFEPGETSERHRAEVAAAEAVTPVEKAWLDASLDRDGRRDEYEEALLRFLEEESGRTSG
jgi:hypothetical protein